MKILALNIGKTTTWAVYNYTNCDKIVGGRLVYKKDPEETLKAPYKRFSNILENALYNHNGLDKIYYTHDIKTDLDIIDCYSKALKVFCTKNNLTHTMINLSQILLEDYNLSSYDKQTIKNIITKKNKYIIEDHLDAIPIIILEYILNKTKLLKAA